MRVRATAPSATQHAQTAKAMHFCSMPSKNMNSLSRPVSPTYSDARGFTSLAALWWRGDAEVMRG